MDEMTRGKVHLQRITDDKGRQALFARRKQGLFKSAMELSVLCDCDVAVIVFGPPGAAGQRLYQYSSSNMDELLERYAAAVVEPHERRRNGELLRHYYELSPDEDEMMVDGLEGEGGRKMGREADGGPSTSAAAAAATMAMVDSIILGGGGRRQDGREVAGAGMAKRMRTHGSGPSGLPLGQPPGGLGPGGMVAVGGMGAFAGGMTPNGSALGPGGPGLPFRRVAAVGGAGPFPLEGIRAAGFLDKQKYPVSPRSERALDELTAAFDSLTELRAKRGTASGGQGLPLQPLPSSSGAGSLPLLAQQQQQLQQLLVRQQQQKSLQQQQQQQQQQQLEQNQQQLGGAAKRFKPLSILVPEIQSHPIIQTSLTPLTSNAAAGAAAAPGGPGGTQHQTHAGQTRHAPQQQQHQAAGGLPPRPPNGRTTQQTAGVPPSPGGRHGAAPLSPVTALQPSGGQSGLEGGSGGSGGSFAFDQRRSGGTSGPAGDDTLGGLMGGFRTSLDGSAAALLSMPSPPPHGGAAALFGSLDGGPLGMRSSGSHGMLTSLGMGLDRTASLGLGSGMGGMGMGPLESPGGPMDSVLRGLAPMDVLDWPSSSPRSSMGNGELGGPGTGGFADEGDGDGGTILDGLVVRGTALSKLAPEAREAAIGPSPNVSSGGGGGTPSSSRGGGGGGDGGGSSLSGSRPASSTALSAFADTAANTSAAQEVQRAELEGGGQQQQQQHRQQHLQQHRPGQHDNSDTAGQLEGGQGSAGQDPGPSKLPPAASGSGRDAGKHALPSEAQAAREPGQQEDGGAGDAGGLSAFMAAPDGLLTELSFNDLGVGGRRGSVGVAAAAAAALAAAAAQQQEEQQRRRSQALEQQGGQQPGRA